MNFAMKIEFGFLICDLCLLPFSLYAAYYRRSKKNIMRSYEFSDFTGFMHFINSKSGSDNIKYCM